MKRKRWILYPYSIFHANTIGGFVHPRFINNPAAKDHNLIIWLIIWYGQRLKAKHWSFFSAGLWIKHLLSIRKLRTSHFTIFLYITTICMINRSVQSLDGPQKTGAIAQDQERASQNKWSTRLQIQAIKRIQTDAKGALLILGGAPSEACMAMGTSIRV